MPRTIVCGVGPSDAAEAVGDRVRRTAISRLRHVNGSPLSRRPEAPV